MKRSALNIVAGLVALAMLLSGPQNAGAVEYTFTKIADTSDGVFSGFGSAPSINSNGTLAFVGELVSGGEGVFTGSGGPLTTIADTIGNPQFGGFESPFINDNGTVVFIPLDLGQGAVGIFKGSGGALTQISDISVGIGVPSINNSGTVAFAGAGVAVFTGSGGPLTTIADISDDLQGFRDASIDNAGTVAFFAAAAAGTTLPSGGDQGIFTSDGTAISTLIDNSGPIITIGGPVAFNDVGMALFEARLTIGLPRSILTSDGNTTTLIVDGNGPLGNFGSRNFGSRSINNAGAVAFIASLAGFQGDGIFTGPDPIADKVIFDGDSLFGRPVFVMAMTQKSLNDAGQIAFLAFFQDGTSGVFRADPFEPVAVDIKPQSCPNPLNVKSHGVLPVAILGTADFDVTAIDTSTILLEGVAPLRNSLEDVATPFVPLDNNTSDLDCTDQGPDGFTDVTLKFDAQAVIQAIEASLGRQVTDGEELTLTLTGELFDGTPITGEDVVVILKKGK